MTPSEVATDERAAWDRFALEAMRQVLMMRSDLVWGDSMADTPARYADLVAGVADLLLEKRRARFAVLKTGAYTWPPYAHRPAIQAFLDADVAGEPWEPYAKNGSEPPDALPWNMLTDEQRGAIACRYSTAERPFLEACLWKVRTDAVPTGRVQTGRKP